MTERQKSIRITKIIHSLNRYGLGDIEHNKDRPVAALILCVCFIDAMAAYTYNSNKYGWRWIEFVNEYLYPGKGGKLYGSLRSSLLHNYSLNGVYGITIDKLPAKSHPNLINLSNFVEDITQAFNDLVIKLKTKGSPERINALSWEHDHPILKHKKRFKPLKT